LDVFSTNVIDYLKSALDKTSAKSVFKDVYLKEDRIKLVSV